MASSVLLPGVVNLLKGKKDSRENVPTNTLDGDGKVIGVYFSAHWCPPCRGFTPKLAKWYTDLKQGDLKDKFDIVFVSSDREQKSFDEYFDDMPWLALPYDERELKTKMSSKYKVSGIPTLLMFDAATGDLINKNGRSLVEGDPKGEQFPWREPTLKENLAACKFVNNAGAEKSFSDMEGKPILLYFSAHWCPPCKGFTPILAKFYKAHAKDKFELIFVSSDKSKTEYDKYMEEMPWYALPFESKDVKTKLSDHFDVQGIPHLVVLNEDLKVVTDNGRAMVERDPEAKDFPWGPKPLDALHSGTAQYINSRQCMVYVSGDDTSASKAAMEPTALEYFGKNKDNEDSIIFLYTEGDDLDDRLLQFINVTKPFPKLILIDIPNNKKYVNEEATIDVKDFLTKFESGSLTSKGLRE